MMYLKKIMKVMVIALVICILTFSVVSASASYNPPIYTFLTQEPIIGTIPPTITDFIFTVGPFFTPAPSDSSSVVSFADVKLRDALMLELGVASNELTKSYLGSITGTLDLSNYEIEELKGIQYLTSLDGLILRNNKVGSKNQVRYLRFLTNLEYLDISALSIEDLPSELSELTNLRYLDISANRLETLPSSFKDFNLEVLKCNYCYFNISDATFGNILIEATEYADYQYQLTPIDFYLICETSGIVTAKWDEMPDIHFPNGAYAKIERFSVCEPNTSGSRNWLDSESRSKTSYRFTGLSAAAKYAFIISADYYIKNTVYDGKYVKYYVSNWFQPTPQDTPTPSPTATFTPTPTPTATLEPVTATPEITAAPADIVTINPTQPPNVEPEQDNSDDTFLIVMLVLIIVLIVAIIGLIVVMYLRMNNPVAPRDEQTPPRS